MMPQKFIVLLMLAVSCQLSRAQSEDLVLISSGGGMTQSGSLLLSYSLGEPCISYTQSGVHWVTEGFQQPGNINLTSVDINSTSEYSFRVYPNPVANELHIESTDPGLWQLVQIVNVLGQPILTESIVANDKLIIDITRFSSGVYLLYILDHTSIPVTQSFIKL